MRTLPYLTVLFSLVTSSAMSVNNDPMDENFDGSNAENTGVKVSVKETNSDHSSAERVRFSVGFSSDTLDHYKQKVETTPDDDKKSTRSGTSTASSRSSLWDGLRETLGQSEAVESAARVQMQNTETVVKSTAETMAAIADLLNDSNESQNLSGCCVEDSPAEQRAEEEIAISPEDEAKISELKEQIDEQQKVADDAYDKHEECIAKSNAQHAIPLRELHLRMAYMNEAIARIAIAQQQLICADMIQISCKGKSDMELASSKIREGAQEQLKHWSSEKGKYAELVKQADADSKQVSSSSKEKRTLLDRLLGRKK